MVSEAFSRTLKQSKQHNVDMRTGAYLRAVSRVARAIELRGGD